MASGIDDAVTYTGPATPEVPLDPASAPDDPTVMRVDSRGCLAVPAPQSSGAAWHRPAF